MPYGTIKVDNIIFTNGGSDQTVTVSGIVASTSGNLTVTGTISGGTVVAPYGSFTSLTGVTTSGTNANFQTITGAVGVYTTSVSGRAVNALTANIVSGVFASGTAAAPSITFTGNTAAGIYSPGTDQVAISTSGTQRLSIGSTGSVNITSTLYVDTPNFRVGIGTASPSEKLTVSGGSIDLPTVNSFIKGGGHNVLQVDATRTYFYGGTSGVQLRTADNTSDLINITNAGLVGLGTSSPGDLLTLNSAGYPLATFNDSGTFRGQIGYTFDYGYFHVTSASNLVFRANGSERLRIDSSGQVGIGTSAPSELLMLNGATPAALVRTSNAAGNAQIKFSADDTNYAGIGLENTALVLRCSNSSTPTSRVTITNGGLVGIGTTSPSSKLHVAGGGSGSRGALRFSDDGGGNYWEIGRDNTSTGDFTFNLNSSEKARIDISGRLLVGTSSTSYGLSGGIVNRNGGTSNPGNAFRGGGWSIFSIGGEPALVLSSNINTAGANTSSETARGGIGFEYVNSGEPTRMVIGIVGTPTVASPLTFWNESERMRIDNTGRLLVGTSTSASAGGGTNIQQNVSSTNDRLLGLHFGGASATGPYITLSKSRNTGYGSYTIVNNGDVLGGLIFAGDDGTDYATPGAYIEAYVDGTPGVNDLPTRLVFSTTADGAASPTERMRIGNNGFTTFTTVSTLCTTRHRNDGATAGQFWNVGPDSGNTYIVYNQSSTGVYITNGGTSWTANSDERLKTGLEPITEAAQKVSSLRAVTGRYLTDDETVSRAFLIAQDVQAVLPEAVNVQQDSDGTLGLQYTDVIPLLVAAIKEQQAMIADLKDRVAALESA